MSTVWKGKVESYRLSLMPLTPNRTTLGWVTYGENNRNYGVGYYEAELSHPAQFAEKVYPRKCWWLPTSRNERNVLARKNWIRRSLC